MRDGLNFLLRFGLLINVFGIAYLNLFFVGIACASFFVDVSMFGVGLFNLENDAGDRYRFLMTALVLLLIAVVTLLILNRGNLTIKTLLFASTLTCCAFGVAFSESQPLAQAASLVVMTATLISPFFHPIWQLKRRQRKGASNFAGNRLGSQQPHVELEIPLQSNSNPAPSFARLLRPEIRQLA